MNYFKFYDLNEAFNVDEAAVKRKFYQLSKAYHPDFFVNDASEKQQEILELSTINNKAFQVLSTFEKRLEYILQLHNQLTEGDKYQLPQDFLMEIMEVNEALMELEFESDQTQLAHLVNQVDAMQNNLRHELIILTSAYDSDSNISEKELLLLKIKDLYYRQKYLLRIRESLNKFASR